MLKKIGILSIFVVLLAYLIFAVVYLNPKAEKETLCKTVEILIMDKTEDQYLSKTQVLNFLHNAGIDPVGKSVSKINTDKIETQLEKNRLIKNAECFKTIEGTIKIRIYQRTPILRIISNKGNYYIDNEGEVMPVPNNFSAFVPIATGYIEESYAKKQLYELALFLRKDKFWNAQIEQIYLAPNGDIELVPRVGNHQIILGKIENYTENLAKLKIFYEKGLNNVGWNKYSKINLKYKNQVVCTRI
jgi:cell division protein FtsQ